MLDLATRAHNHSYRIDPIVRSLLDTDFYKFLMLQFIWLHYRTVPVTFSLINRTTAVRLADAIPEQELRAQLDHARTLRVTKSELIWLAGNTFYGQAGMFRPDFLAWLAAYQLPAYHLAVKDGQYELTFSGPWAETTLWEIPALAIVNTLRNRQGLQRLSRFELDVLYAQAKTNLWRNLLGLREAGVSGLADFGTRRRHDYLYHEWAVLAARDVLGPAFTGTSNVLLAMRHDIEAIGTPRPRAAHGAGNPGDGRRTPCEPRSTTSWPGGKRPTAAGCSSSCPIPTAPRSSWPRPPTGSPTGRAFASTPRTRLRGAKRPSPGGAAARPRPAREVDPVLRRAGQSDGDRPPPPLPRSHPHRVRLGHSCSPTTSGPATPAARPISIPSA